MHTQIFHSVIWQTTTTVIESKNEIFLFDPNYFPAEIRQIESYMDKRAEKKERKLLAFTHSDFDHIVGFSHFSHWETIGQKAMAEKSEEEKQKIIQQIKDFDGQYYVQRVLEPEYPRLDVAVDQEKWLETSEDTLYFLATHGHTKDGLVTFFTHSGILVVGDMLSNLEFPFIGHSIVEYMKNLEKIREKVNQFGTRTLIPGHGAVANSQQEIQQRIEYDLDYLKRMVDKVNKKLQAGKSLDEVVKEFPDFLYKGKAIEPYLQSFHIANIQHVAKELKK